MDDWIIPFGSDILIQTINKFLSWGILKKAVYRHQADMNLLSHQHFKLSRKVIS
ncbi:MAG: hypothetical protein AAGE96_12855 [Cyanobacteria bacterium P01_G01_bin.19]